MFKKTLVPPPTNVGLICTSCITFCCSSVVHRRFVFLGHSGCDPLDKCDRSENFSKEMFDVISCNRQTSRPVQPLYLPYHRQNTGIFKCQQSYINSCSRPTHECLTKRFNSENLGRPHQYQSDSLSLFLIFRTKPNLSFDM